MLSNAFYFIFLDINQKNVSVMNVVTHTVKMEREISYVYIVELFYYHDFVLVAFILKYDTNIDWNV